MRNIIIAFTILFLFDLSLARADDGVGPCNSQSYFYCDEDGNCTCLPLQPIDGNFISSITLLPGYTVFSEGGNLFAVSPGDQAEILSRFVPEPRLGDDPACEVVIESSIGDAGGNRFDARSSRLAVVAPSGLHNYAAVPPRWLQVDYKASFVGCTSREIHSFSASAAIISGRSGVVRAQAGLRLRGENFYSVFPLE